MPDPVVGRSVSASQMAALFNCSPYLSRFMLWTHFARELPLPATTNSRMEIGDLIQEPILKRTAYDYRLQVRSNTEARTYRRRGRIGHTRDGAMRSPNRGRGVVEAKNVDYKVWATEWTERQAAQHIEIQLQAGIYADRADWGVIAALVGGNRVSYYEREPNPDFVERMRAEVEGFYRSIKKNETPDPMGLAAELPMLAQLYPETDPGKVLEQLQDKALRELLIEFEMGSQQATFGRKILERARPKILAIARDCSIVRANAIEAHILKTEIAEETTVKPDVLFAAQAVRAWARIHYSEDMSKWPRELRRLARVLTVPWVVVREASLAQRISTYRRPGDPPLPGDDVIDAVVEAHGGTITP